MRCPTCGKAQIPRDDDDDGEAGIRLADAAPEMLEACQAIRNYLEAQSYLDQDSDLRDILIQSRAAIAKATK